MTKKDHSFTGIFIGFVYCIKCGELKLKSAASRKACKGPCLGDN